MQCVGVSFLTAGGISVRVHLGADARLLRLQGRCAWLAAALVRAVTADSAAGVFVSAEVELCVRASRAHACTLCCLLVLHSSFFFVHYEVSVLRVEA